MRIQFHSAAGDPGRDRHRARDDDDLAASPGAALDRHPADPRGPGGHADTRISRPVAAGTQGLRAEDSGEPKWRHQ
jgi:hypothetical protein